MNWLKIFLQQLPVILCDHNWEKEYSYASLKDVFASPPGNIDRSGTIYVGQKCKVYGKSRTQITVLAKDGSRKVHYKRTKS